MSMQIRLTSDLDGQVIAARPDAPSTADCTTEKILAAMREIQKARAGMSPLAQADVLVMLHTTLHEIEKHCEPERSPYNAELAASRFWGYQIQAYPTIEECQAAARLLASNGRRVVLVTVEDLRDPGETIPM
jgi:hypothetical protein